MSEPQRTSSKGHTRNKSSTKTRPRSSTKGPLDVDDTPLSSPKSPAQRSPSTGQPRRPDPLSLRSRTSSPAVTAASERRSGAGGAKDFSFLIKPEIYHPLTPLNVPLAFRNSPKQPDPDTPLDELISRGHFRAAAIAAVQELTGSKGQVDPRDHARIFSLLYTRLACLTLIDATSLAAQEVKALEDPSNARLYVDESTGEHLIPWDLRVLIVRLQALGFNDARRAVMSYHDLGREARIRISRAAADHDSTARELWKARLHDLGIKVAGALIEMDDVSGAASHLANLRDKGDGTLSLSKALLWIHLGDVDRARSLCASAGGGSIPDRVISALCDMADASYEAAAETWQGLRKDVPDDEMVGINAAVCLLYLGKIQEGRDILEELVESGASSHTLLFNLSTMYELCTERNRGLKMRLAEQVSRMDESSRGWEKTTSDFKLLPNTFPTKTDRGMIPSSEPTMSDRVSQIAGHLNYPKGLLDGQVAIITGSGQGIGAEAARLFANEGAKVVVADIDANKGNVVAESINKSGGQAISVPGNVLDDSYLATLVSRAADFGQGHIHIIVNNAGYTWDGVIHKMTDKQWDNIVALHCTAPFKLVRAASAYFRVRDGAPRSIVNISSTSGIHGNAGQINYSLAKAGVTGLTKTIAKEWGPAFGVRCNAVAFGHILTRLTADKEDGAFVAGPDGEKIALGIPAKQKSGEVGDRAAAYGDIPLRRAGSATEAASSILAVASPLFSYVTGQTIMVTGGRNM
ncbi:3-oxoacyl-[acyl-carrier protein] reductase [Geosmithia morbida]|uniref:3-oxoacyl-[acyl-carrier-protein] reductase n=1 Tax=Geosmithia morbida TaxID=1094350 RepID=A0A9P4YTM6_9HYPO|nr:3-oxoacyl-[acyl-carrier protein] reductase [Geosmithia morbida]KAF4122337.1 3-oxoacyl-[acyl-carrier protein] reductase [Geosmithia morbida]